MYTPYLMLRIICLLFGMALSACAPTITETVPPVPEPERAIEKPIEQLPSTFSIPYFSSMRLAGTGLTIESVLEKKDAYIKHAISYRSNGLKISGVLLIPNGNGPFPLLIFNHGYIDPRVYTRGRGLKREQDYLARQGFAVLHTDYRQHGESDPSPLAPKVYDGSLEYAMDSANAILAMRAFDHPTIDEERVGMLGHSLGGGVTLAILTGKPDLVDAAILYAPVNATVWENFMRWLSEREEGDKTLERFQTPDTNPVFWRELSPSNFLDQIRAPILLFHGDKDKDVPKSWSDDLAVRLKDAGKTVTYVEYPGEGHEYDPKWGDFMEKSAKFFRENLGQL